MSVGAPRSMRAFGFENTKTPINTRSTHAHSQDHNATAGDATTPNSCSIHTSTHVKHQERLQGYTTSCGGTNNHMRRMARMGKTVQHLGGELSQTEGSIPPLVRSTTSSSMVYVVPPHFKPSAHWRAGACQGMHQPTQKIKKKILFAGGALTGERFEIFLPDQAHYIGTNHS
jgi:hypothetical protein